jgi:hypothetical protein
MRLSPSLCRQRTIIIGLLGMLPLLPLTDPVVEVEVAAADYNTEAIARARQYEDDDARLHWR